MKETSKFFSLLLALLVGLTFTACSDDDEVKGDDSGEVAIQELGHEVLTAEEMCDRAFGPDGANSDEETAELRALFMEKIHAKEDSLAEVYGSNGIAMGFVTWTYLYKTTDQHGNPIWLSSVVSWAQYWLFGWHDLDPDNLYLVEHYTVLSNAECPSNSNDKEVLALGDNLVIIPDYIGYGTTRSQLHPYLNHEVCAINSIDAMKAGYDVFKRHRDSGTEMEDDWKMYVLGCSQGGGNALAVHKYLDTHPDLAKEWRFAYSYCCAGPYSPRKTLEYYYNQKKLTYPVVLPMVIKSMIDSYPEILGKWKEEDFYCEKYLKVKSSIDKILSEKESTSEEVIAKMKELLDCKEITISDILNETALDTNSEMIKALFQCLDKNDLTTGWTPSHTIKLYHSKTDDIVPYDNATAVVNAFPGKVSMFNSYNAGHVATCTKWFATLAINNW